jgi:hypothetical protein
MAPGERLSISFSQNMKHILALHISALLALLTGTLAAHSQPARVYSDGGNIFIERGGGTSKLTASEMDLDPVLSPSAAFVVYTRRGRGRSRRHYEPNQFCPTEPRPDEPLCSVDIVADSSRVSLPCRLRCPHRRLDPRHGIAIGLDAFKQMAVTIERHID